MGITLGYWDTITIMTVLEPWKLRLAILGRKINFTPRPVVADTAPTDSRPKVEENCITDGPSLARATLEGYKYKVMSIRYLIFRIIIAHEKENGWRKTRTKPGDYETAKFVTSINTDKQQDSSNDC